MYTYITPVPTNVDPSAQTEADVLARFETDVPITGGYLPLETIEWLAGRILGRDLSLEASLVHCNAAMVGAPLPPDVVGYLAGATVDTLVDLGGAWAEHEHWASHEANPMDLSGALIELGATCATAVRAGWPVWVYVVDDARSGSGEPSSS